MDINQVEGATVAAVSDLFAEKRLTHVPVMETSDGGEQRLRGLLSAAKIKRLLSPPAGASLRPWHKTTADFGIKPARRESTVYKRDNRYEVTS